MKASTAVLLISSSFMMMACSQITNGVAFEDFKSASLAVESEGTTEEIVLEEGEQIDSEGNLVDENGIVFPACDESIIKAQPGQNVKSIVQSDETNVAEVFQSGDGNIVCIIQQGKDNKAHVEQEGSGNSAYIFQSN
jgi:hypothetical protein